MTVNGHRDTPAGSASYGELFLAAAGASFVVALVGSIWVSSRGDLEHTLTIENLVISIALPFAVCSGLAAPALAALLSRRDSVFKLAVGLLGTLSFGWIWPWPVAMFTGNTEFFLAWIFATPLTVATIASVAVAYLLRTHAGKRRGGEADR